MCGQTHEYNVLGGNVKATTVRMQRIDGHVVIDVDDLLRVFANMIRELDCEQDAIHTEVVTSSLSVEEKAEKMQHAIMATGAACQLELLAKSLEKWKADEIRESDEDDQGEAPTSCDGCHYNQDGRCQDTDALGPEGGDLREDRQPRECFEEEIQ